MQRFDVSEELGLGDPVTRFAIEEFRASDGYAFRYRRFVPTERIKGQLVCVHGIQSHGGWYEYSCGQLCQAGFSVCFLDRRGAGLNSEARGDAPSFRRLVDDLAEFIKTEKDRISAASSSPLFLVAISWGGK